jgi:hypothetical protein
MIRIFFLNDIIKDWQGCEETESFIFWWLCQMIQPFWKTVWQFLKKNLNMQLLCGPTIVLLGICPREVKLMFT